ncbi:MAG: hypothetical protein K8S97_12545 [Anaerolineae bacterium]|nr:hypothetical protein [Anaerolineae bacterium]
MVGNGNHPLKHPHYDEVTLEEYVLGQLLPNQEAAIRQHLEQCSLCRVKVAEYRRFCCELSGDLQHELDRAKPGPQLSFDHISTEWHKPRRQFNLRYRLQPLVPSISLALVAVLLVGAFLFFSANDTAALSRLDITNTYDGPPAMIAASTESGLVVLRLDAGAPEVVQHLSYSDDPRNLRFSPDGRWLAFQEKRVLHVLEAAADGAHHQIDVQEMADWSWSPDGTMLAYTDGAGELAVFDVATQVSRVIAPAEEAAWGAPVWSVDGRQLAYAVVMPLPAEGGPVQRQGLWRADPVTGYRVELARNPIPGEVLLVPTAWVTDAAHLLAWDVNAAVAGDAPGLYWIDVAAHFIEQIDGKSLAQGMQLAWPVSAQNITLSVAQNRLFALDLQHQTRVPLPEQMPWPQTMRWAANGEWMAYTITGAAEGRGLYILALDEQAAHQVTLPEGALEKAAFWVGAEHLFVVRQAPEADYCELWLAPLTTDTPPQRILTHMSLPETQTFNGWRWGDVVASQMLAVD